MKLHILFFVLALVLCCVNSAHAENLPSWFKEDKNGILWFQKGNDGQTKYSASLVLSAVTDGLVITVTSNEKHIDDAVGLAVKMRDVLLKKEGTPSQIPIVAWKDQLPGVGYTFYTDGTAADHKTIGKEGQYTPSEAKQVLDYIARYYRVLRRKYAETGKWGKHQKGWKPLQIVKVQNSQSNK